MKKLFILLILLSNLNCFAQFTGSSNFNYNRAKSVKLVPTLNFKPTIIAFNFFQSNSTSRKYNFSVYNSITNLNDNYTIVNNKYYLSNLRTVSYTNFNQAKIDSFNPSGVDDFGSALVIGVFNLLFDK